MDKAALVAALSPYVIKAVNFLVDSLTQLLKDELVLRTGAKKDLEALLNEIKPLNKLLAKGYALQERSDDEWKNFFDNIQRIIYRAEDAVDKFVVDAKLLQDDDLKRIFSKWIIGWKTAPEIKAILQEVRKIRQDSQQVFEEISKINTPDTGAGASSTSQVTQATEEDIDVVGFDDPAKEVVKRLVEGSKRVVPIEGMPGIGKTTLARKIYNDAGINDYFFKKMWVYVGQSYNKMDICHKILENYTSSKERLHGKDEKQLAEAIRSYLAKGDGSLIVLDDVWDEEIVDFIRKTFPDEGHHRIMMTTRELAVAERVCEVPYSLKPLDDDKSFELLEKRAFIGNAMKCPDYLKKHAKTILDKCSGVPLAIVVIAGALRGSRDEKRWQLVAENVGKHLIKENEKDPKKNCLKVVETSYNHLPPEEKTAFLYFGVFPRGFDIPVWKLVRLWIVEGLIKSDYQGSEIEVIAEFYLNDFVSRNLVMVMQKRSDGRQVKTCRVHDMLHEFCNLEAKRLSLFHQLCPQPGDQTIPNIDDPNTSRRVSIQSSILYNVIPKDRVVQHVRSFLCFSSKQKQIDLSNLEVKHIPNAFPLIRVLDIESLSFSFSKVFFKLFHLRYIAVSGNFEAGLPSYLGNFWNLQTLILHHTKTSPSTLKVDEGIWKMLRLRHLHTNIPMNLPAPTTQTSASSCLRTLSKVTPDSCKKDVLAKACNLKRLGIEGRLTALLGSHKKSGFNSFEHLKCLEHLKLLNYVSSEKLRLPLTFFHLQQTLRKLTLSDTKFDWSEADKLGQLKSLEVLKLKENAFTGKFWEPKKECFSKLQVLWIHWAADLETWDASNGPFESLRLLVLKSCPNLKAVPQELADLPYFQEIQLVNTFNAYDSAEKIKKKKEAMQESESTKFVLIIIPPRAGGKATL